MWHRLSVGTSDGESCGYQWRDIDQDLFTDIASGNRPQADTEAQNRDSSSVDANFQDRTMYYLGVWDQDVNDWTDDVADPASAYTDWAQEGPGA
jgi:hypothetical protein